MLVLSLLPILALGGLILLVLGRPQPEPRQPTGPIHALMVSLPLGGAILTAITEGLSLFHAITRLGLSLAWLTTAGLLLGWAWRSGNARRAWSALHAGLRVERGIDRIVLAAIALLAVAVLAVALAAPPNTIDVLQYHMPRVVHWAQQRSLDHFAAANFGQNPKPIWAETAVLNLRVLWGDDRPAGLVQWLVMLASAAGVAGIAGLLGGSRRAQWLAAALAISIPVGFLQAPTAMNDYASAWWIVCLAYCIVLSTTRVLSSIELLALSAAVGLGMLTKGTFFPFAIPLTAWFAVAGLRRRGLRRMVAEGLVAVAVVGALNAGFWYRNLVTYGDPYGGAAAVTVGTSALPNPSAGGGGLAAPVASASPEGIANRAEAIPAAYAPVAQHVQPAPAGILEQAGARLAKLARMTAMNLVTPIGWFNRWVFGLMRAAPEVFPSGYIEGLELAQWNNEMTAGNPVHLAILTVCMAAIARFRKSLTVLLLAVCALFGFALVSLISYSDWIYGIRYQLAFFLLGSPLAAVAVSAFGRRLAGILALGLLLYAVPYLLFSNMRPMIGRTPWPTRIESVFVTDPAIILFAQSPEIRDEYELFASQTIDSGCRTVGLSLNEGDPEYTWWWLLQAPQSRIEIEHRTAYAGPDRYLDPGYPACAVLCTICQGISSFDGLPLAEDAGHVQLYMRASPWADVGASAPTSRTR